MPGCGEWSSLLKLGSFIYNVLIDIFVRCLKKYEEGRGFRPWLRLCDTNLHLAADIAIFLCIKCSHLPRTLTHSRCCACRRVGCRFSAVYIPVPYNTECLNPILAIDAKGWKHYWRTGGTIRPVSRRLLVHAATPPCLAIGWLNWPAYIVRYIRIPRVTWLNLWRFLKISCGI